MAKNRAQLQEQRNKAVVKMRQAKNRAAAKSAKGDDSGWAAVRAAGDVVKSLGDAMRTRVSVHGDTTGASHAITVANVDEYVKSDGTLKKKVSSAPSGSSTAATTTTSAGPGSGTWAGTRDAPDVRGGFNPGGYVDYTNTNPSYWASAVRYFKAHPDGNPLTGELGIWIPNLEKEGAERTALAAIAGGVTAHVNSNYSNNTVSDVRGAGAKDGAPG